MTQKDCVVEFQVRPYLFLEGILCLCSWLIGPEMPSRKLLATTNDLTDAENLLRALLVREKSSFKVCRIIRIRNTSCHKIESVDVPQQLGLYCGVFLMAYMFSLVSGQPISIDQKDCDINVILKTNSPDARCQM
ncbi:uncharacterized protein LOC109843931 isoform X2 [Asparagus officinalis]|uniref:uncharacterized protein LOC109843931 isoform X2 n=1 Tax=Asparagus officinalis TaxID=4686 RepID=UPI00098DE423|nr:uncharacterized protein LOC109843931 isoform X2 [Asparagus officinalis]